MIDARSAEAVLDRIHERDLVELALHITSVEAPPGEEGEGAELIYRWLADNGFSPRRVGMFEDRFNVFAEVPGSGGGPALAFNSHIDTWMRRDDHLIWRDPGNDDYHLGREDGDLLVGNPVVNDKGPMAAWMLAAMAIRDAGVRLKGSIYLTMVPGEIGQEPVDEFQGKRYLSKEVGARYLVNHTPRAGFCVCAEATAFRKGWIEAGKAFYKITVYGGPVLYTPYVARPYPEGAHPNAIVRALPLISRLEEWALEYEQRHTYESPGGTVVPRVNVSAIRAGQPWLVLQNPEVCMLYLDIRTVPGQDGGAIGHELRELLDELGLEGTVEQFVDRPGYEARGIEPLSEAVDAAHRFEFGTDCEIATPPECSMWRDHNVFNEAGIPSLTYGPPGVAGAGTFAVRKEDLLRASRVYALTALAMCAEG
ncbi:MAG TPA: M20/M25/M40 family metallo-hydrolase [Thermoleophilaceae bacterium]|nr:M20/M25/M40 family metallo-hydrolase [Thermoleophilaceae bacterium]